MTGNAQVQRLFNSEYLIIDDDGYALTEDAPEWAKQAFEDLMESLRKIYGRDAV